MNVLQWLGGHFTNRSQALWLYRRGMARAQKHDHQGAVDDYTSVIATVETPLDVKAMALYNRALVHVAAGNEQGGADDLNRVLAMDESAGNVRTMANKSSPAWRLGRINATHLNWRSTERRRSGADLFVRRTSERIPMSEKKPTPMLSERSDKSCPVCGKRSYSQGGVHPQCAVVQADTPRRLRLAAERKKAQLR